MGEILRETLGLQLLHWAFARSDVWLSASRCAVEFMKGIHEPLERSAAVLDGIWTAEDEDCGDGEDQQHPLQQQQQHQQQRRRRWNNGHWCEYDDYEARRDMWLHGLEMNVQRHNFGYADGDDYDVETPNNNGGGGGGGGGGVIAAPVRSASPLLLSPPHNNSALGQRENMQVTQPISAPSSPLASPGAGASNASAFAMPSNQSSTATSSAASSGSQAVANSGAAASAGGSPTRNANSAAAAAAVIGAGGGAAAIALAAQPSAAAEASLRLSRAAVYPTMITTASSSSSTTKSTTSAAQPYGAANANAVDTTTGDPNWQANKATVRERNAAMFNNDLMSDITFVVGGGDDEAVQTIPAHKYVLATGSSVFYAMFFGGLADTQLQIHVPDVEPMAFLTLLKYLYCDEITLEADNVLATLYAAKKYIVPHLARACVNYLETSLTAKNACLLLSQSRLFEEPELMQRCWEVIDAQAEMAIKSEGFVDIDLNTFESILGRETLNCKEINLFEAALCWAQSACQKMEIDSSAPNRRQVLGKALQLIRIPTMTLEEFANGVAQLGILTADETIDIFLNFTATVKPQLGFQTRPRAGLKTQVCHRFQSCAYRSNQWRYRGRCDSIQFSVDKRIFIVGFGLYGSSTGAADYNVKIELKRMGRVLAENETHFYSDGSSNTFHVFFEDPIQVEPDSFYTASVVLDGTELSFFGQEGMTEVCMGNVQFQFQCSSESTNGTGVQGGQIPELIFYGPTRAPEPTEAVGRQRRSALDELNAENERRERELELHPRAALLAANGRGAAAAGLKGAAAKGNSVGHNAGNNSEGN